MRPRHQPLLLVGAGLIRIALLTRSVGLAVQEPSLTPAEPTPTPVAKCTKVEPPVLVHKVDPDYPGDLRQKGVQGVVILEGIVATDGTIVDIRVLNNSAEGLATAAIAAARQYLDKPAMRGATRPSLRDVNDEVQIRQVRPA